MTAARRLADPPDATHIFGVYNAAIGVRCRAGAPLAGASLDRTALRRFARAQEGSSVRSLVCAVCACVYPH
eukprot:8439179-Prorocentrum_lima.AAC.1